MENITLYVIYPIIVSIVITFINKKIEKIGRLKKEFYLKFCTLHLKIYKSRAYNFTDLDETDQNAFINLIIENEKYAKGILLELFQDFMMCVSEPVTNEVNLNKIFNEITEFVVHKVYKRKNKISKIERWKYNKIIKNRDDESNQIFYIKTIEKDGIISTNDENHS